MGGCAHFRFYEELNDFLPAYRRKIMFEHAFKERAAIKDMIEALGVPHKEVDLILVNGQSVDFNYIVKDDDRISVYPLFESFDITAVSRLRPRPLRRSRFVVDSNLGGLAFHLRMLGFDTLFSNDYQDNALALLSRQKRRILLTRNRQVLKRHLITHGYYVRETRPRRQLLEVLRRFDLFKAAPPLRRCLHCNGRVMPVTGRSTIGRLPPDTKKRSQRFRRCRSCGRIYREGSHYRRMHHFVEEVLSRTAGK